MERMRREEGKGKGEGEEYERKGCSGGSTFRSERAVAGV